MKAVWELAKAKMVCEGGTDDDDGLEDDLDKERKNPHGGCGNKQPLIRKDGLKLYAHFRASASDVSMDAITLCKCTHPYILLRIRATMGRLYSLQARSFKS
jgi:hypothetical protein